jgi:hypothetical protein
MTPCIISKKHANFLSLEMPSQTGILVLSMRQFPGHSALLHNDNFL